jgi:DNA-directed RNA polymerase sigma subunit (sigma70/sigma32)
VGEPGEGGSPASWMARRSMLSRLNPDERKVIEVRYFDEEPRTLEEVVEILRMDVAEVCAIEESAMTTLSGQ